MIFPNIGDIATRTVVTIDIDEYVNKAIDKMLNHEHRNVVVIEEGNYYILSVVDILNLKKKNLSLDTPIRELTLSKVPVINKNKNVLEALEFLNNKIEYICVLDDEGSLYGIVTHTDITSNIDPDTLMDNYRLQDFLKVGRIMKSVSKDESASSVLDDMMSGTFDNIIIVESSIPIGILTTKDVMRLIKDEADLNLSINEYMSTPVDTINKSSSIKEALAFINEKHYKRAVVVDDKGRLAGIITQKELISLTYSRWAMLMKEYQEELHEINSILESKNREIETKASTDSLTGLYNRSKFSELYLSTYKTMIQRDIKMSVVLLDIDYFKKINDTYGHNAGDRVLIQISHVLLKTLRDIDIVCRWGGEEFIVLLPTVSLEVAKSLAEKLRQRVEDMQIDVVGSITASFGVSEVVAGDILSTVVDRADRALYLAKKSGRNCVKTEMDI